MTIILQITEIPENETLKGRVLVLPPQGGTLGTAFDCTLQLPDRTQKIAPVHGRFVPTPQGMTLEPAAGSTQILINNHPIVFGRPSKLEDGAIINVGGYTILATESSTQPKVKSQLQSASNSASPHTKSPFSQSVDSLLDNSSLADSTVMSSPQTSEFTEMPSQSGAPHFSAKGVFAEDPFGDDPFDDTNTKPFVDTPLESHETTPTAPQQATIDSFSQSPTLPDVDRIPTIEPEPQFESESMENLAVNELSSKMESTHWHKTHQNGTMPVRLSDSEFIEATRKQDVQTFDRLVTMLEEGNNRAARQQTRLFKALDQTLSTFLEEFSPKQLEDKFTDYYPSRFGRNKKYFWKMYQREFQRRHSKKEFHRLFKAILLDNLQSHDD